MYNRPDIYLYYTHISRLEIGKCLTTPCISR